MVNGSWLVAQGTWLYQGSWLMAKEAGPAPLAMSHEPWAMNHEPWAMRREPLTIDNRMINSFLGKIIS